MINLVNDNRAKIFTIERQGKQLNKAIANKTRGEKKVMGISGNGKLTKEQIKKNSRPLWRRSMRK